MDGAHPRRRPKGLPAGEGGWLHYGLPAWEYEEVCANPVPDLAPKASDPCGNGVVWWERMWAQLDLFVRRGRPPVRDTKTGRGGRN